MYYLVASIDECGSNPECAHCLSEVYIYSNSATPDYCTHNACGFSCEKSYVQVSLTANVTYTLYVCKLACPGETGDCDDCPETCTARATVTDSL
jgi:hypothetical protein